MHPPGVDCGVAGAAVADESSYRRYNRVFCTIICVLILAVAGFNWLFDPLMMFHRPWLVPHFSSNERYRVPGFARSLDYDTALVGASSAMAVQAGDMREVLRVRPVMQVVGGATIREESLVVTATARQGKARRIIWILDPLTFNFAGWRADIAMPTYLYEGGAGNLVRYLLDRTTARMSLSLARGLVDGTAPLDFVAGDIDEPYRRALPAASAYSVDAVREAFHSEGAIRELNRRELAMYTPFDAAVVTRCFAIYVADVIRAFPGVAFDVVLAPSSTAYYQFIQARFPHRYDQNMLVRELAYAQIPHLANARLFDMQIDPTITEDYANFSDMLHFSRAVGHRILETIRDGKAVRSEDAAAAQAILAQSVARVPPP